MHYKPIIRPDFQKVLAKYPEWTMSILVGIVNELNIVYFLKETTPEARRYFNGRPI